MKIIIGGAGWQLYEIESSHEYAKEISESISKVYNNMCAYSLPKIIKDMEYETINNYLLSLFYYYENNFNLEDAKQDFKSEIMSLMSVCANKKEEKNRDNFIRNRMEKFGSSDVERYLMADIRQRILSANEMYELKIQETMKECIAYGTKRKES